MLSCCVRSFRYGYSTSVLITQSHIPIHYYPFTTHSQSGPSNNQYSKTAKHNKHASASYYNAHTSTPIDIVYGDIISDQYIIINKPANLPVQALEPLDSVELRLKHQLKLRNKSIYFPHRLDKATTGLLIVVFSHDILLQFNQQIANKSIHKSYRAVVQLPPYVQHKLQHRSTNHSHTSAELQSPFLYGSMITPAGELVSTGELSSKLQRRTLPCYSDNNIQQEYKKWSKELMLGCACYKAYNSGLSQNKNRLLHPIVPETLLYQSVNHNLTYNGKSNNKPRSATTLFDLIGVSDDKTTALYNIRLVSGRTHQIRIHLADAGLPIINDPYYNLYYIWNNMQSIYHNILKLNASQTMPAPTSSLSDTRHTTTHSTASNQQSIAISQYTTHTRHNNTTRTTRTDPRNNNNQSSRRNQRTNTKSAHWRSGSERYSRYDQTIDNDVPSRDIYSDQWNNVLNRYGIQNQSNKATQNKLSYGLNADDVYNDDGIWEKLPDHNVSTDNITTSNDTNRLAGTIGWLIDQANPSQRMHDKFTNPLLGLQAYKLSYQLPSIKYKRVEITLNIPDQWHEIYNHTLSNHISTQTSSSIADIRVIDDITNIDCT